MIQNTKQTEPYHKFELFTEDKNFDLLVELAGELFPKGFTLSTAYGYWQGAEEPSICIAVIVKAQEADLARISVEELAKKINTLNNQTAVLVFESIGWGQLVETRF